MPDELTDEDVFRMLLDLRVPRPGEIYRLIDRFTYRVVSVTPTLITCSSLGDEDRLDYSVLPDAWADMLVNGNAVYTLTVGGGWITWPKF